MAFTKTRKAVEKLFLIQEDNPRHKKQLKKVASAFREPRISWNKSQDPRSVKSFNPLSIHQRPLCPGFVVCGDKYNDDIHQMTT